MVLSKAENNWLDQMEDLRKELENHYKALTVIRDRVDFDNPCYIPENFMCLGMTSLVRNQVHANMKMIESFIKRMRFELMESEEK